MIVSFTIFQKFFGTNLASKGKNPILYNMYDVMIAIKVYPI